MKLIEKESHKKKGNNAHLSLSVHLLKYIRFVMVQLLFIIIIW